MVVVVQPLSLLSLSLPTCGCTDLQFYFRGERERERRGAEVIRLSHVDDGGSRSRPLDVVASGDVLRWANNSTQTTAAAEAAEEEEARAS